MGLKSDIYDVLKTNIEPDNPGENYVFSDNGKVDVLAQGLTDAIVKFIQAQTFTVTQPGLLYSTITSTNISCFALADGTINLITTGGIQQYSFEWAGPNGYLATTGNISNLNVGTYSLTVTDITNVWLQI